MGQRPRPRPKSPIERWRDLSPPERIAEYAKAAGQVVAQTVAAAVFLITGLDVFTKPDFLPVLHQLDASRAQDIFIGLAAYYGIGLARRRGGK